MKNWRNIPVTRFFILLLISIGFCFSACSEKRFGEDVVAQHAMVATAHPIATQVGMEILHDGGNAVDAAVAIAISLSIAEPNASGIGGGGFMVIKMEDDENAFMVDYREMAPKKAVPKIYYATEESFEQLTTKGPMAIGVPGLIAGANLVLKKYGTMSLQQVVQPAIRLAREGVTVSEQLNGMIVDNLEKIMTYPATSEIYLKEMLPLEPGSVLRNLDLANSLELIADQGKSAFYQGEIARAIVAESQKHSGIMELNDLKAYQAKYRNPVRGSYRGYEIISAAPPSGGGTHLIELLNIMEGYDVKSMGHNSAGFIHRLTEAMKMIYADKFVNAGDPDFYNIPVEQLTDKAYADQLRQKIDDNQAKFDYTPPNYVEKNTTSTSHLSVVDSLGNIVALTQSINYFFGSGIVADGTGILLNNHMNDFNDQPGMANSIGPHKRPVSNTAPTIVIKDGKPFMTLGTPGGARIISALAQIIMNVVDFGMSMDEAIEAPRVHCSAKKLHVEGRIKPEVIEQLQNMGHDVEIHPDFDNYFGGAQGILINSQTGKLMGGADSRRDGVAMGY